MGRGPAGTATPVTSSVSEVVYAEQQGLLPSGGTIDNTDHWNDLVAAFGTGGFRVVFGPGTYYGNFTLPSNGSVVHMEGAGPTTTILERLEDGTPTLDISGTHPSTTTTARAVRHSINDLSVRGGGDANTTTVIRMWYASNIRMRNVHAGFNGGTLLDCVEAWDSTFWGCRWDSAGGTDGTKPTINIRQRVTGTASGMGHSNDNSNNLDFVSNWLEEFSDGGLWVQGEAGVANNYYIRWIGGKIESASHLRGVPVKFDRTVGCEFLHSHIQLTDYDSGYSTPVDAVQVSNSRSASIDATIESSSGPGVTRTGVKFDGTIACRARVRGEFGNGFGPSVALVEFANTNTAVELDAAYSFNPGGSALLSGAPTSWRRPTIDRPVAIIAGAPDDTTYAAAAGVAAASGSLALDTTNHRLYVRDGSTWKYAGLT